MKDMFNCEYMCLVLFVVSKILDLSGILSRLLEMGVEYYLVCIREGLLCAKGVEPPRGRGSLEKLILTTDCVYIINSRRDLNHGYGNA